MRPEYIRPRKAHKVLLETADGKAIEAELTIFQSETLSDAFNSDIEFFELKDMAGNTSFIAKSFIRRIFPKADNEEVGAQDSNRADYGKVRLHAQDPYLILDVSNNATDEDVRIAYHKLVRAYHPDKFAGLELPPAILDYGEEILKKINAAYEMIVFQRRKPGSAA